MKIGYILNNVFIYSIKRVFRALKETNDIAIYLYKERARNVY